MSTLAVSPHWLRLSVGELRGTVMVVGAPDTGKSTLARYLFQELGHCGICAAYLDADPGQGILGLPTTMKLALAASPGGGDDFPPKGQECTFFVGSNTPRGHMLPSVIGAYRLQQQALRWKAEVIVVDTSGLVDIAQGGKALKQWKIELLAPTLVVGLQRGQELEPVLWPLRQDERIRSWELPVSPHVVARSREERILRRRERLAQYFELAQPQLVVLRDLVVHDIERLALGALLAFQEAQGFALGLGVVEQVDRRGGTIIVRTPLGSLDGVVSIRFGSARWDVVNRREV